METDEALRLIGYWDKYNNCVEIEKNIANQINSISYSMDGTAALTLNWSSIPLFQAIYNHKLDIMRKISRLFKPEHPYIETFEEEDQHDPNEPPKVSTSKLLIDLPENKHFEKAINEVYHLTKKWIDGRITDHERERLNQF